MIFIRARYLRATFRVAYSSSVVSPASADMSPLRCASKNSLNTLFATPGNFDA